MKIQCQSCLGKTATFFVEIHCYNAIQCYVTLNVTTAPKSKRRIKMVNFYFAIPVCSITGRFEPWWLVYARIAFLSLSSWGEASCISVGLDSRLMFPGSEYNL